MRQRNNELHQIGALPYFINPNGGVDICLVTSRGGGRWIVPKGNPIRGLAPHEVAGQEALEEAGLIGQAGRGCIGTFSYSRNRNGQDTTCSVDVYAMQVERQLHEWDEMHERTVLRCNVRTALSLISAPGLADLINKYVVSNI